MIVNDLDHIKMGPNILPGLIHGFGDSECRVYQMRDETGEGVMTTYPVIDGVYLMFNDFHMRCCNSQLKIDADIFCIDHCREGRIEHQLKNGFCSYLREGDLRIDNRSSHYTDFSMPLSHYHGITIAFFLDNAERAVVEAFPGFPVNIRALYEKYCAGSDPFVIRSEPRLEHLLSEFYAVPGKIKDYYYRIKIFELLLYLEALEISDHEQSPPYFYKTQVEKIKAIQSLIVENLDDHFTLEQLSVRFDIPLTNMKICFKGVFGTSIYAYMRSCRMNRAAVLLKTTDYSVARIAGEVGYSSPSKFSAAFRDIMMTSPVDYRRSLV